MANLRSDNAGVEVFGISLEDLKGLPRIANPETSAGDIDSFESGIAIGSGVARELGATVGDTIRIISPNGVQTAFGTSPRINAYEVVYVFSAGRYDIDRTRVYLPFAEAQSFFKLFKSFFGVAMQWGVQNLPFISMFPGVSSMFDTLPGHGV